MFYMVVNLMTVEVNKGGRPVGSVETPLRVIGVELKATVKTIQSVREMIESQIKLIEKQLINNNDLPITVRLEALERLGNVMINLTKNVETLGKYSIGDANRRKPAEADDINHNEGNNKPTSGQLLKLLGK